jgi:toxin CptA
MHSAPSVSYPVGRSRFLGRVLAVLWLVGVAVMVIAWQRASLNDFRAAIVSAAWGLAGLMACRFWVAMPQGELRWDGHAWSVPGASIAPGGMCVRLDWQRHLLVRLQCVDTAHRWLWLSASAHPARWNDLRRAVYSRAMTDAPRDAANP